MGRKRSDKEDKRNQPVPKKSTPVTRGPRVQCINCSKWFLPTLDNAFTPINHNKADGTPCNY